MSYLAIKSDDAQICHKDTNATTISLLEVQVPKVKGQKWEKKKIRNSFAIHIHRISRSYYQLVIRACSAN